MAQTPAELRGVGDQVAEVVAACRAYVDGVDGLLDALERDMYQAADRCWRLTDRQVQLRSGMLRNKAVVVQEALFQPDVEQQDLAGSLEQWRRAVESSAASAALQVKTAEQQLTVGVARYVDPDQAATSEQLLAVLNALLGAYSAVLSLHKRDLHGTLGLLCQLAVQVAAAWRAAGGSSTTDLLAGHETAPQEVITTLTAPLEAAPADGQADAAGRSSVPPDLVESLHKLRAQQAALLEELSDAADMLRFWSRRGEKAVAGADGSGVREGDVPPMLAEAQAALWAACQAYDDEQGASDLRTRQLVCQRYRPTDVAALTAAADDYADGERLPAQPSLTFESEFVQERGYARTRALAFLHDDAMVSAAGKLYQLQYLLLEAQLPPETATAWQQLLVRIAEALLNGSTPPAAVPLLAVLLQQGLRRQEAEELARVSERDKARLVPMICRGLAPQPSGQVLLREHEGVGLLQSLLKPEAMLNAGQLQQFYDTLKMTVESCAAAALPAETTASLLAPFDATRFAVLACEQWGPGGGSGGSDDDGSSTTPQHGRVSMQQLLMLAHASLAQPGADSVGTALLEGLLTMQPASFMGAALQLALACSTEVARRGVLGMLCRVPTELLLLPVLADALTQLAEAIDGNQLAPPFLPYDLLSRLYRSPHVLHSLQLLTERGHEAASAEASRESAASFAGQKLWTARVGGSFAGDSGGCQGSDEDYAARAASGSSRTAHAPGQTAQQMHGGGNSGSSLVLLPLQPSSESLAALLERLVGAVLSCLLRRAGAALDSATLSEELLQLLEVLLMPAAEQGAWHLQWLWSHLYQESLRPFLADASAAVDSGGGGPLTAAFLSYWSSLPWRLASFHAASPAALTVLRLHLVASGADGAAAVLLRELDFAPVMAKAAPAAQPQRVQQVYSLGDEEEEEELGLAGDPYGRGAWAAELALLALHAGLLLPPQEQPEWLRQLLHGAPMQPGWGPAAAADASGEGEADVAALMRSPLSATMATLVTAAGEHQPLLPHLLAVADWQRLAACMKAEQAAAGAAAPWLLLPLLLAPASIAGDVGARLVHAASLLSWGALLAGSAQAADCAAGAISPILLCTLCQGTKHQPDSQRSQRGAQRATADSGAAAAAAAQAEAQRAQQEQVVIPEGFPMELLADTVEGQQLLLLQQQEREQHELEQLRQLQLQDSSPVHPPAAGEVQQGAAEGEAEQRQALPLVEVRGCWSPTADQHTQLLQHALLPLAASQASWEQAASLPQEHCPPELVQGRQLGPDEAVLEWRQPALADLLHAASSAAADATAQQAAVDMDAADGGGTLAGVAALLLPLARQAITILTSEQLPFSNAELPLDTQAALYVSLAPEAAHGGGSGPAAVQIAPSQRRGLHQTLAALLPGARQRAQQDWLVPGAVDAQLLRMQLRLAVQEACKAPEGLPLTACVLRLLYACPMLHTSAEAQQLSEGLLRFLAAPERDGGPLGQGASASILAATAQHEPDAPASVELSVHSAAAEVVGLQAAGLEADTADTIGQAAGAPSVPVGGGLAVATEAAQGLPPPTLLGLALGAADLHAPLTCALAVERLRQGTTVLPKDEWQELATQVLHVAVRADAEAAHPFDLVAVWLAALAWVADSRWRRLPSGPHQDALLSWLEALELRVVALRLAHPDDFTLDGGSPGGGSPNRLLSGAADRFKAMRQRLTGQAPAASASSTVEGAAPQLGMPLAEGGAGASAFSGVGMAGAGDDAGEQQLGQKLSRGFRNLLGRSSSREGAAAAEGATAEASAKKGWGERMKNRVARMGRGSEQGDRPLRQQSAVEESGMAPLRPTPTLAGAGGGRTSIARAASGLGTLAEEAGSNVGAESTGTAEPGQDVAHLGPAYGSEYGAGGSGTGGSGKGQLVKHKISSGFHAMGRGLSRVKTKLSDRPAGTSVDEVAERDQDVAIRVGLAAFAVSAYIKSVLCPSLASRLGSDSTGPATPTVPRGSFGNVHHRQTSSLGRLLDAEYMREFDRVLEARTELDSLELLIACPLLQLHPDRYQAFLQEAPRLLSAATGVEAFSRSLQGLLFSSEKQLMAWN